MNIQTIKISELKPAEYNPRIITKEEFEGLKESLKDFGQQENLIVNKDMTVISGHQRLEAMKQLGFTEATCNLVDLNKHDERKLNLIMNSPAISGKYDDLKLAEILEELKLDDNYTSLRLNALEPLDLSDKEIEEDEAPEVSTEEPVSKLGEIYQLGRHRVMCGDSTDFGQVSDLMDGKLADMVFTDPPYGVKYVGGLNDKKREMIEGDDTEIYSGFMPIVGDVSKSSAPIYLWFAERAGKPVFEAVDNNGYKVRAMIVWNKQNAHYGNFMAQYMQKHEPCLYIVKDSPKWYGATNETTVWDIEQPAKNEHHPTQKPIALPARAINNSSKAEDIILDLFLGSGSTLIACEQTDRICYGMELDGRYCDVIRKRYAKFIGKEESWQEVTPAIQLAGQKS